MKNKLNFLVNKIKEMEIYEQVCEMSNSDIINHPLLAYDESVDDYIREKLENPECDNITTDEIYSLFLSLATRHLEIEENEGDNLKYLFKSIESQLEKISKFIELDSNQLVASLEYIDISMIPFILYLILSKDDYQIMSDFVNGILALDFDEDRNYEIFKLLKGFHSENEDNKSLFRILISSENWMSAVDMIRYSLDSNNQLETILQEEGDEIYEYFK